jgi:hypothetical protein
MAVVTAEHGGEPTILFADVSQSCIVRFLDVMAD